jgi:hypothetical protein
MLSGMRAFLMRYRVAALVLLLPAGAVILGLLSGVIQDPFDDSGFGWCYGVVQAKLSYATSPDVMPRLFFSARFEGWSQPGWHWVHPSGYRYRALRFVWYADARYGEGQIDTSAMTLAWKDRTLPISRSSLSQLLLGVSPNALQQEDLEAIDFVERLITEAGQGRLMPPRHHPYSFETPVSGDITHVSCGFRLPYSLYWWTGIWTALCLWIALRAWLGARAIRRQVAASHGGCAAPSSNSEVTEEPPPRS